MMNNKIRPPTWFALAAFAAFAGAFLAVWLTSFFLTDAGWCPADGNCLREWIGATSGWAAAAGAGGTIYILLKQLTVMQRQTDFIVGDARPTVAIVENNSFGIELRFVNWNRNVVTLNRASVTRLGDPEQIAWVSAYRDEVEKDPTDHDTGKYFPTSVPGWEDRSKPPPVLYMKADIGERGRNITVLVRLDITINGNSPQNIRLEARTTGTWELLADQED
jgi:hypothetical protein